MIFVHVTMPVGTRLETTDDVIRELEAITLAMTKSEIKAVIARTGFHEIDNNFNERNGNLGMLHIEVAKPRIVSGRLMKLSRNSARNLVVLRGPSRLDFRQGKRVPPPVRMSKS